MMRWRRILCLLVLLPLTWAAASAQPQADARAPTQPIRVGLHISPPFVMQTPTGYSGFAIELFEAIAGRMGLRHEYRLIPGLPELLTAVAQGEVDVVVTNLTITHDRLTRMDFTQPWFDGGLRIMINQNRHVSAHDLFSQLQETGHLRIYLWLGLGIVAGTIVLTLVDRYFDPEFPREWHRGVAESFYHVMAVVTSGAATAHKELFGAFGRILSALWMVLGVVIIAYITSSITSVMTTNTLNARIAGVADLSGKTVGVLRGSSADAFAMDSAWSTQSFDSVEAAVAAVVARHIDAVVGDSSVLEYFDNSHPELPITEVGGIFRPEKYGFALPIGSTLQREFSRQIIMARENGYLDRLRAKYFGNTP